MENPFENITQQLDRIERLLEILSKSAPTDAGLDKIGGIELAMDITGLARPTIYVLSSRNKIPHFKKNKKLYFSKEALINWIKDGRRKTRFEIAQEAELMQIKSSKKRNQKMYG